MKSVIVLKCPNYVRCPQLSIPVQYPFNDHKLLEQVCQAVSPLFVVSSRPYYKEIDAACKSLDETLEIIKNAVFTFVDNYNYKEIDTWHQVEDGVFDYTKFKQGKCKVSDGKLYQLKKEFQRCPLKFTIRNVADSSYLTIEKV